MNRFTFLLGLALTSSVCVAQTTIIVPSATHPTIQSGIAAAVNNDTVLVAPGSYTENIDLLGKDIVLRGLGGPAVTTINGSGAPLPAVSVPTGSTRACVIEGFTITGGTNPGTAVPAGVGGGIRLNGSSPTIRNCVVRGNSAALYGGGIGATDLPSATVTSPLIVDCVVEDNFANGAAFASGGGIAVGGFGTAAPISAAEIRNCVVRRNTCNTRGGGIMLLYRASITIDNNQIYDNVSLGTSGSLDGGAGIFFSLGAVPTITNNRIFRNRSSSNGGGIKYFNTTGARVVNNTITGNTGGGVAGFANAGAFGSNVTADLTNNIVWNNGGTEFVFTGLDQGSQPPSANVTFSIVTGGFTGTGNLNVDPQLLNGGSGNHRLSRTSPARNVGSNAAVGSLTTDFEGDPRVVGGTVDIGADEFVDANVLHWANLATMSIGAMSNITYSVDGGAARANNLFAIFFGISGTEPGVNLFGLHLPLNIDVVTTALPPLTGAMNASGVGTALLPFGSVVLGPQAIGLQFSSAAAVLTPGPVLSTFTNPESITFVQ